MASGPNGRTITAGAVILAAGRSRRMGQPKLLLPWGETSILGHLLLQWQGLGVRQLAIVCAQDDLRIAAELDRLAFSSTQRIFNSAPERGMFSSLQCAARWANWEPELTHWAIVLGDQPHLSLETLTAVLGFSAVHRDKICQPRYEGHRRHPVLLPRWAFERLADTTAGSLREFLDAEQERSAFCELSEPGLALDLDCPEDYQKALEIYKP